MSPLAFLVRLCLTSSPLAGSLLCLAPPCVLVTPLALFSSWTTHTAHAIPATTAAWILKVSFLRVGVPVLLTPACFSSLEGPDSACVLGLHPSNHFLCFLMFAPTSWWSSLLVISCWIPSATSWLKLHLETQCYCPWSWACVWTTPISTHNGPTADFDSVLPLWIALNKKGQILWSLLTFAHAYSACLTVGRACWRATVLTWMVDILGVEHLLQLSFVYIKIKQLSTHKRAMCLVWFSFFLFFF